MVAPGESPESSPNAAGRPPRPAPTRPSAALRSKYEVKAKRLRDQLMAAEAKVDEFGDAAQGDLLSTAGSLLGSFLGGRRSTSAMARESRQRATAGRKRDAAADKAATIQQDAAELEDDAGRRDRRHRRRVVDEGGRCHHRAGPARAHRRGRHQPRPRVDPVGLRGQPRAEDLLAPHEHATR